MYCDEVLLGKLKKLKKMGNIQTGDENRSPDSATIVNIPKA